MAAANADEGETDALCLACLDAPARCALHPCMHRVTCVRCTVSLEAAICPACRHSVHALDTRDGSAPIPFAEVQRVRAKNDEETLAATLQIVFAAVPDARAEAQRLVDAAINAYPLPATVVTGSGSRNLASATAASLPIPKSQALCGLLRFIHAGRRALSNPPPTKSTSSSSMSSEHVVNDVSPAALLPLPTPFGPNACVAGKHAQFSLFALPAAAEGAADVRAVAALLRARRPDFVFICAPAQPRRAAKAAMEWDARLRSVLGAAELPRRAWLLVGATDARSAATKITPDVAAALEVCPARERPSARIGVLQNTTDAPRSAVKFAKTAVRYAVKSRAAENSRGCTHPNHVEPQVTIPQPRVVESSASGIVRRIGQSFLRGAGATTDRSSDRSTYTTAADSNATAVAPNSEGETTV